MNPSGSFKDNGMSAAFTHARIDRRQAGGLRLDRQHQRLAGPVLLGHPADEGGDLHRLGQDRLRQALAGARLRGADRPDRRRLRRRHGPGQGSQPASWASTWSTASIPSGWKARRRSCSGCSRRSRWEVPDWIVVPGGNLGNSSAFGKAFHELHELGLIDRVPRLAVINAAGANTLYELYEQRGLRWNGGQADLRSGLPLLRRDGRRQAPGRRRSPAPSRSTGR